MQRGKSHRSLSEHLRAARHREEQEQLLDEEVAQDGASEEEDRASSATDSLPFIPNPHADLPVYISIHRIHRIVKASIDDPYSLDQLKSPRLNVSIVRPLVDYLYSDKDVSIIYCLLVNRAQFLREQSFQSHHQTVNNTRAMLCELLATRILRRLNEASPGREGLLLLANILVAGFEPFQGAPDEVADENRHAMHWMVQGHFWRHGYERLLTALEVAILTESKVFLSSTACQRVVDAVYVGKIIYTPTSYIDILPDHYKHKAICIYNPKKAPILNQYRLIVPRTRNIIEVTQFLILLALYMVLMVRVHHTAQVEFSAWELFFCVYAWGWVLDEFASILEHGWYIHTQNLWSFLDVTFVVIYFIYFTMRMHSFVTRDKALSIQAVNVLSVGAPVLLPRLAFNLMPENMLFISLRAMMGDFTLLTALAIWCFAGFLLALRWLSDGDETAVTIAKWMLWIWFGLDGTGVEESVNLNQILGPILMVLFAFLGNTLFLTILVSMLSNTFSRLAENSTAEIQFRRAVLTFEGVKSDSIFNYRPPFNILAVVFLLPMKFLLSPRWFHKINVSIVRFLNAPLLVAISYWERRHLWKTKTRTPNGPSKRNRSWWDFSRFAVHGDLQAVFDIDVPQHVVDEIENEDVLKKDVSEAGVMVANGRRFSSLTGDDEVERLRKRLSRHNVLGSFGETEDVDP